MEYYSLDEHHLDTRSLSEIADRLNSGDTIIFPTDSIYAMGCSLHSKKGIEKICSLAGKKKENANLSLICSDFKDVAEYTAPMSNSIFKTMKGYLPGPYTFILNADQKVKRLFSSKKKTVGIRIPDCGITLKLIEQLGHPLVSTSLHSEDEVQQFLTEPDEIIENHNDRVDMFLDNGAGDNIPSTVLDCTTGKVLLVREGKGEL
jgi:tRNA threonylcarbamoyl adenosine modification protein (Sua5/YciO/YrdC/YwlC family)